jgi:hypothetical protein
MQGARLTILVLVGVLLLAVAFATWQRAHRRITPTLAIPADQLPAVVESARGGDANSAARLSRHYLQIRDYRDSWIWMRRAQRSGYAGAESDLNEMRKFFPPDAVVEDSDATR